MNWAIEYGVPEMFHEDRHVHTIIICPDAKRRDAVLRKCAQLNYPVYGYRKLTKEESATRKLMSPVTKI